MQIFARQGDLVITQTDHGDGTELRLERDPTMAGSAGSEHRILGAVLLQRRDRGRISIRLHEPTQLVHGSRHRPIALPAGDYTISPLRERGDAGDRIVED